MKSISTMLVCIMLVSMGLPFVGIEKVYAANEIIKVKDIDYLEIKTVGGGAPQKLNVDGEVSLFGISASEDYRVAFKFPIQAGRTIVSAKLGIASGNDISTTVMKVALGNSDSWTTSSAASSFPSVRAGSEKQFANSNFPELQYTEFDVLDLLTAEALATGNADQVSIILHGANTLVSIANSTQADGEYSPYLTIEYGAAAPSDTTAPLLVSAIRDSNTRITVGLDEAAAAAGLNKANDGGFTVEEAGNPAITYAVTSIAPGMDAMHVVLTVNDMERSGKEGVTVKYTAGGNGTIADSAGNALATNATGLGVAAWDVTAPTLTSSSAVSAGNVYVDLTFSEGVYGDSAGTTGLGAGSLEIANFAANGGTATGVAITSVKRADATTEAAATALAGGETTVRVFLSVTGTPSGTETFEVKAASAASIYDLAGNASPASLTTGAKTLQDLQPPALAGVQRDSDTQLTVELSKAVTSASATKANNGGFTVTETGNAGIMYTVSEIELGTDPKQVVLTVANLGRSAKEGVTVTYTAGGNGTIADSTGNALATNATGLDVTAWDVTAPTLSSSSAVSAGNVYVDLTFSEGVYGNAAGTTGLSAGSLTIANFAANGGTATGVAITSVKRADATTEAAATALAGGETTVRVFLSVTGTPSGSETFEVKAASAASIHDLAGNASPASLTTGAKTLQDLQPPALASVQRDSDTQLTVELSKAVTPASATKMNNGGFTVTETGNAGITYTVSEIELGTDAKQVVLTVANLGRSAKEGVTVTYAAGGNGTIADSAGNALATDATGLGVAAWDVTAPTLSSSSDVSAGNVYVDLTFSEGVYGDAAGTTGLSAGGLEIANFTANGGTATGVAITSVKRADATTEAAATALAGGETTVRVFLSVTGTPSGTETFEVKAASATSIHDLAGNASPASLATGAKTLQDLQPPALASVQRDSDTQLTVELSKAVTSASATKANNGGFTVTETGNAGITYTVSEIELGTDPKQVMLTVANLGRSAKEGVTVTYAAGGNGTIADSAGNALATNATGLGVAAWDVTAPTLSSSSAVSASNVYVDLTFSEGVYGNAAGTTGLSAGSLEIANFTANGGTATGVAITSVKRADATTEAAATALAGGETTVRVFLSVTGTPSGTETFEVKAASATSIHDLAGNASPASLATGAKTLQDLQPPALAGVQRDSDTQLTVELSKAVTSASATKANNGGFTVTETGNAGVTYAVTSIELGTDPKQVVLTVANLGRSAKEGVTVTYTSGGNGTIADSAGNALATNATGLDVAAWDVTAPTLTSSSAVSASNVYVDLTFSEGVYGNAAGTTGLSAGSLEIANFTANGGTATGVAITSVKRADATTEAAATALAGGETTVRVFLSVTGTPSGTETFEVKAASAASIHDLAGNASPASLTTGAKTLQDLQPPALAGVQRDSDTQLTVELSKAVTSASATKMNNGGFTVTETGNAGVTYAVTSIELGTDAKQVVLTVANLGRSAKEGVTVTYTAGGNGTIVDSAGNALATDAIGLGVAAWDVTAPTIVSALLASGNAYVDLTFSEGVYGDAAGSLPLSKELLSLIFEANGGGVSALNLAAIAKNDAATSGAASPLTGGETIIRVFLQATGVAKGVETVVIKPTDGASIYDAAGNPAAASQQTAVLRLFNLQPPGGNSGGSPGGGAPATSEDGIAIIVNGVVQEKVGSAKIESTNNEKSTTVIVDEQKLRDKMADAGSGAIITIPVTNGSNKVTSVLSAHMVKQMQDASAVLVVQTERLRYTIPAGQLQVGSILERLGAQQAPKEVAIEVVVREAPASEAKVVKPTAHETQVGPTFDFDIYAVYQGKRIDLKSFTRYVERSIALPAGLDPNKITTGVVVSANGKPLHVPTRVERIDSQYYATINSLTNSSYTLIYNEKTFADISGHWSRESVEDMASRLIVSGVNDNQFRPDAAITRAEFIAIAVRALGLHEASGAGSFKDVKTSDWFYDVVSIGTSYGLIKGYEDGSFKPQQSITREEAMVIMQRIMPIVQLQSSLAPEKQRSLLAAFADGDQLGQWAREAGALAVESDLMKGYGEKLLPKQLITRAETATIMQRLLKKAKLI